jgi:hypothetical protein
VRAFAYSLVNVYAIKMAGVCVVVTSTLMWWNGPATSGI